MQNHLETSRCWSRGQLICCSGNVKSWPEAVIEHLVERQGQPRGVQVQAVHLNNWKGWIYPPPGPHLRVGSGSKAISCQRSLPTWGLPKVSSFFFIHFCMYLGLFSFAVAKDFATLLLLLYFLSHYSITYAKEVSMAFSFAESQGTLSRW